jgi:hypothetical protein
MVGIFAIAICDYTLYLPFQSLAANGVAVVGPVYINEFLVSDPPPKVDEYLLEEFKPFWANRMK